MNRAQNSVQQGRPESCAAVALSFSRKVFEPLPIYMVDNPRAVALRHDDTGSCWEQGQEPRPVQRKLTHG